PCPSPRRRLARPGGSLRSGLRPPRWCPGRPASAAGEGPALFRDLVVLLVPDHGRVGDESLAVPGALDQDGDALLEQWRHRTGVENGDVGASVGDRELEGACRALQ